MAGRTEAAALAVALLLTLPACGAPRRAAAPTLAEIPVPAAEALEPDLVEHFRRAREQADLELRAANDDAGRAAAFGRLAMVYDANGSFASAAAAYAAARRLAPESARWPYLAGFVAEREGRLEDAREAFAAAAELAPADSRALAALASVERQLGETDGALKSAERAVALTPDGPLELMALAEAAAAAGRFERSAEAYERLLNQQPRASKLRAPYALVLRRLGRIEAADRELAARGQGVPAVDDPLRWEVQQQLASARLAAIEGQRLFEAGHLPEAIAAFERAVAAAPADVGTRWNLGVARFQAGQLEAAIGDLLEAARLEPGNAEIRFNLATVLAAAGRSDEAIPHFEAALALEPGHAGVLQNLGNVLLRAGRAAEAVHHFRALTELQSENLGAWLGLAAVEAALGREVEAKATLERARGEVASDWRLETAWCRLAAAARDPAARDPAAALASSRRAARDHRNVFTLETLAMALAAHGDFAAAAAAQSEAIELAGPGAAAELRARLDAGLARYRRGEPSAGPALL